MKKKKQLPGTIGNFNWMIDNPLMTTIKLSRYKFISKMLSEKDIVLDLGCGQGLGSIFYSKYCKYVYGYDLYSNFIHSKNSNLKFIKGDIKKINKKIFNKKITFISLNDVIEHFSQNEGKNIISNCKKILGSNDGGTLIIGTPNINSRKYRSVSSKKQHVHEYDPLELKKICEKYFKRVFLFSMNDELVHTGFYKFSWFFFLVCTN